MELSVFSIAAVFLSSLVAAMGLGGGTVLQMQSLNLLLFLPAAALSLFFHWKNKLISFSLLKPCIPGGIIGGILGSVLANMLEPDLLRKAFGLFLLVIGLRELLFSLFPVFKKFSQSKA